MQSYKEYLIFIINVNGNLNKDIQLMWTLLMEMKKELEQLNVNQNCIHRTVWNI
jgi:hypothetical protein